MGDYKRPTVGPQSPQFQRWLVLLDVMPDVGALTGFEQIDLGKRTLNVRAYGSLLEALELLRDASRNLRSLTLELTTVQSSLRYAFLIIDAGSRTCVTQDLIAEWAKLETKYNTPRGNASALSRDMDRAGKLAKTLTGKGVPVTRLLDGVDPIPLFAARGLWHADDVPQNIEPEALEGFEGAVPPDVYDAAVKKARKAGNAVWIYGLVTLPSMIEVSIGRVMRKKVDELIQNLTDQGYGEESPRLGVVGGVVDRLVSGVRHTVARDIYAAIIRDYIDYSDEAKLDLITRSVLETAVFSQIPRVYQTGRV